ncbi:hypothetical protein OROHE_001430 [Orobanche hederae]
MRAEFNSSIPSRTHEYKPNVKRSHLAGHYAHHVKEWVSTGVSRSICVLFLALVFLFGLIALIIWLSLRPYRPRFHVQEFSIPGLAQLIGPENVQIIYNVTARNANKKSGIYYDSTELAVYYRDQRIGGSHLLFPFYQEPKNTTVIAGLLGGDDLMVTGQRWNQFKADQGHGEVFFRVEISSTTRFRTWTWVSRRNKVRANCPAGVGPDGLILSKYKDNSKSKSRKRNRTRSRKRVTDRNR